MSKKIVSLPVGALVLMSACLLWGSQMPMFAQSPETRPARECPFLFPVNRGITAEVVRVRFTHTLPLFSGNRIRIPEDRRDEFRFGVVTIKITKPADQRLTLAAADLTLHYYHGEQSEVAPCEFVSCFGISEDGDRPLGLPGPSPVVKQTTGARSTKAGVVYIDAVFGWMEPDTKEVWITIGQPITERPFVTPRWTP